jgi:hypothetical protein
MIGVFLYFLLIKFHTGLPRSHPEIRGFLLQTLSFRGQELIFVSQSHSHQNLTAAGG